LRPWKRALPEHRLRRSSVTTLLVSVGGAGYPNAPTLRHPSFARSSRALAAFLTTGGAALIMPSGHLDLFDDRRAWSEQLMAIREWLRAMIQAGAGVESRPEVENVIVHYVGHGMFKPNSEEHYLSINATDAEERSMTSASLGELNAILMRNAPSQRRFYLIDACFAAASIRDLMAGADDSMEVKVGGILGAWPEREWGRSGVAALCSANKTSTASARGGRGLTQFTDGLLCVFEAGDSAIGGGLSLRRTHHLLGRQLAQRYGDYAVHPVLVAPEDADGGIAGAPVFPNVAGRAPEPGWLAEFLEAVAPDEVDSPPSAEAGRPDEAGPCHVAHAVSAPPDPAAPASVSQSRAGDGMVPEHRSREPADWGLAAGDAAASEAQALSPEQRFRQAAYRFFRLPHSKKDEIASALDPADRAAAAKTDLDRYKAALAKAREAGAIERLEGMIVRAEGK